MRKRTLPNAKANPAKAAATAIAPKDGKQGDYYCTTLGPYDYWAIEYGYKVFSGNTEAELKKIAARSGEPALQYGSDEDINPFSKANLEPDPDCNQWDLGNDPVAYAKLRMQTVQDIMPEMVGRVTKEGDKLTVVGGESSGMIGGAFAGTYTKK